MTALLIREVAEGDAAALHAFMTTYVVEAPPGVYPRAAAPTIEEEMFPDRSRAVRFVALASKCAPT